MGTLSKDCEPVNPESTEALFYWDTTPEDRTKSCDTIRMERADWAADVTKLVEFFVILISDFLDDPNNIRNDHIRDLVRDKKIDVCSMSDIDTDFSGTSPRIVVEFSGKQSQQNFAIDNRVSYNIHNSSANYYSHWQIGISLYIIGNTLNETLLLAEEVSNFCHCFQTDICDAAGFLRCQIAEVAKPQCLSDGDTQRGYLSTVSVSVVTAQTWTITHQAPVLKRVTFKTMVNQDLNKN